MQNLKKANNPEEATEELDQNYLTQLKADQETIQSSIDEIHWLLPPLQVLEMFYKANEKGRVYTSGDADRDFLKELNRLIKSLQDAHKEWETLYDTVCIIRKKGRGESHRRTCCETVGRACSEVYRESPAVRHSQRERAFPPRRSKRACASHGVPMRAPE
eukprot:GHVU01177313.1.p1 GENE.GHVU01177313.1~~GHVU01177313.1.p1  ORF type:complete len:160 (-),score=18.59 GHVU01177313.1:119-598(-)